VQKVVTSDGTVLLDRGAPAGKQTIDAAVAKNVTAAMEPIAGYSRRHNLAGGRESAAKTGTSQLGDTGDNRDAWMVGFTPSLSTAVWIGTDKATAIQTSGGSLIYGSGLPADIWKSTMDGALQGTPEETFPDAPAINGGSGGVPTETTYAPPRRTTTYYPPLTTQQAPDTTTYTTTTTEAAPTTTDSPPSSAPEPTRTPTPTPTPNRRTAPKPPPAKCIGETGFPPGCVL